MSDLAVGLAVVFAGVIAFGVQQWLRIVYERREERRALEIQYLIEAYRSLSALMNRAYDWRNGETVIHFDRVPDEEATTGELAVSTAALHGSRAVVKAAVAFVEDVEGFDLTGLMMALRQDLRSRLRHEPIAEDFVPWVHIPRPSERDLEDDEVSATDPE